jgi:large subunit ribosomal protein L9
MEVILTEDVIDVGKRGEIVKVADGYGRNYLVPRRLAVLVTPGNLRMMEQKRLALAKKEAKFKEEAQVLANELNQLHVVVSRKAGDTGALFGSVTSKDIVDLLEGQGIHLDRRRFVLDQPIKAIGNFKVEVRPHAEVQATLDVSVLAEGDEPVARVKRKDGESDRIMAELEAKLREIAELAAARKPEPPPAPKPAPTPEVKPKKRGARREHEETDSSQTKGRSGK